VSSITLTLELTRGESGAIIVDPSPGMALIGVCRFQGSVDDLNDLDVTSGDAGGGFQGGQWVHGHGPTTFGVAPCRSCIHAHMSRRWHNNLPT